MIDIRRAASRYRTEQPGITTWHAFSSGAYYDPDNVAFGQLIACDEHLLGPGAGFDPHPHAGVELVSWVLDGTLEHRDAAGRNQLIRPGQAQYQVAASGIRHAEGNASSLEPLRFVQLWLMTDAELPAYDVAAPPLALSVGAFDVLRRCRGSRVDAPLVHLLVGSGNFHVAGADLAAGDSVRAAGPVEVDGDGELLVVRLTDAPSESRQ
ncbi:MAG TPA: pirin family protein [Jatrophihabitans sp.]|nr:pirin family protein [Jatrophihabitans sp.]